MSEQKENGDFNLNASERAALNWHIDKLYNDIREKYEHDIKILETRVGSLESLFLTSERNIKNSLSSYREDFEKLKQDSHLAIAECENAHNLLKKTLKEVSPETLNSIKELADVFYKISLGSY